VTCNATWPRWKGGAKEGTEKLLKQHNVKADEYRMGKTKLFIRNPQTLFNFESEREKGLVKCAITIQKIVRGYLKRRWWKRKLAAYKISRQWRKHKSKAYFAKLLKQFENVKYDPHYGKFIEWPSVPEGLKEFDKWAKGIQRNWAAMKVVLALSEEMRIEVRKKIAAYNLFHGKKHWEYSKRYEGNYLEKNGVYAAKFAKIKSKIEGDILFCDVVQKVSRGGKAEVRGFVVTKTSWYMLDPVSLTVRRGPRPLSEITGLEMSPRKDTLLVVHMKTGGDILLDAGRDENHLAELVATIIQVAGAQPPTVQFNEVISCATLAGQQHVTLEQRETPTGHILFKKSKEGVLAVCPVL
jgi:myosin-1